jgi:hypothetical protein
MTRKKNTEAPAEASRRQRLEALKLVERTEVRANETIALVQHDARAQFDAVRTEAKSRVAIVKDKATKHANNVSTEFAALRRKLQEPDATISAQVEEIAQLREALRTYEAAHVTP